jgi:tetratricopeptide (TPR) repeat protein
MVDLARDHGLRCRGKQTAADVLHVKVLLRAALRLDPHQSQACVWLYELTSLGDQPAEAREVLARLVAAAPANTIAFANWLEAGSRSVQTIEQRRNWLEELLDGQPELANRALVHTRLANLALQQANPERARRHLDDAMQLWPECPDAVTLGLELMTPEAALADRLTAVLRALRANPVRAELAWEAGLLLDESGFASEALTFYEHALGVHEAASIGTPLSSQRLLQLSRNALARGQADEALRYAQQAAQTEVAAQDTYEARFYLFWLMGELGTSPAVLDRIKTSLEAKFAAIENPAESPVGIVSQAAWFYCVFDEQPERALALAREAAERAPGDVFVTRVLGWAQALNQQLEAARDTLTPIAKADPYAAYRLALLLRDAGDADAPARLVSELAYIPPVGRARALLDELRVPVVTSQPAERRFPELARILAGFDRAVLEFYKDPARFLEADIKIDDSSPAPGEPWWVVCSLANRGGFPITLGPNWMVNPVFLLSFRVEGDRERDYPSLLTVALEQAQVIRPGETVRVRRTIDIGPLRRLSRQTPQHLQTVYVTAVLDPAQTADGQWRASITGQQLRPVSFVRLPADTGPEAWHARFSALKGGATRAQFQALEVMAELLGEHQRARIKPLAYRPNAIPVERVRLGLLNALESESWETRVRALDALQVAGLGQRCFAAVQQCLEHPHALVRLMAVRLLARQGQAFSATARRIAAEDEDELVRDMARSYVQRWSTPATEPGSPRGETGSASGADD